MTIIKKHYFNSTKMHKLVSLFLITILFVSVFGGNMVFANGTEPEVSESEEIYDMEFEPGVVLVGLSTQSNTFRTNSNILNSIANSEGLNISSIDVLMEDESGEEDPVEVETLSVSSNTVDKIVAINLESQNPSDVWNAIDILKENPNVVYAHPNYLIEPVETIPNESCYSNNVMWGMEAIDAPEAWDKFTGTKDIVVGVIDTGIDFDHEDLADNLWVNPNPGTYTYTNRDETYTCSNDIHGWNFGDNNNNINGEGPYYPTHGTKVSGTIGAVGNNNKGCAGVNWNVSIAMLRNCSSNTNTRYVSDTVLAIDYAMHHSIPILNYSYDGYYAFNTNNVLYTAIQKYNGLFVWAAGNYDSDYIPRNITANIPMLPNLISVGAINTDGTNKYNYGKNTVHLGAPGVNIHTTNTNNGYTSTGGTSLAAPHVAGAAALLMGYRPELTPAEVKEIILASVEKTSALEDYYITGGILNVNNMLNMVSDNYSLSTPNLTYDTTNDTLNINTIKLTVSDTFPSEVYMVINKYDDSGEITESISDSITINNLGVGEYTDVPSYMNIELSEEYLEIVIYASSNKLYKIVSQTIQPIKF